MPNRYPAPCYRCGKIVEPGAGVFEKFGRVQRKKWPNAPYGVKWQVQHHECAKRWSGTARHHLYAPEEGTPHG